VAGALDMTRQALYHYFPSKEALMRALVTDLLDTEVRFLLDRISETDSGSAAIAALIRSFHAHYIGRLGAFRAIYGQTQLYSSAQTGMDPDTIREEVNPRTRGLFDALEARLLADPHSEWGRKEARRYAYAAWTSALGLVTMLSVADAVGDPLIHRDSDLLDTLVSVFSGMAAVQN
jgi:AcrR family transcriptional regulator